MEALITSTAMVALAEFGDKTQLLAILLAGRFRRPWPIILGILVATLANHALAALAGARAAAFLAGDGFRFLVALSFIAMGLWTLIPDRISEEKSAGNGRGAFVTALVSFFLVEIGDKTQLATVALAARYHEVVLVTLGTTAGMMIANVPAVLLGEALIRRLPMKWVRRAAALLFVAVGAWLLLPSSGFH